MEVLVGFGAAPAYVRDMGVGEAQDNGQGVTGAPLSRRMIFQKKNSYQDDEDVAESDRSSSSIGIPDHGEEEEEEEEEEVSSKVEKEGLGSIGSLEDSLPIKRGLSNHFSGKSKSFTNLAEATATMASAKDLEKTEHPFNKKRRILRWSRNLMMLPTAVSMPLLPVSEEDDARRHQDIDDDEDDRESGSNKEKELPTPRSVFKSYSCFALTDLREEEEEEEEDDD